MTLQKVPVIGQRFIREIPASDNVCATPSCLVGEMGMTLDTNDGAAFLIDEFDSNGEVGWDGRVRGEEGEKTWEMFGKCILSAIYKLEGVLFHRPGSWDSDHRLFRSVRCEGLRR